MFVVQSGIDRERKIAAASILRKLTMATGRRSQARGRPLLLSDQCSECSGKSTGTSRVIRRGMDLPSAKQHHYYITSWILPLSLEPPWAPLFVSYLPPRHQNSLPTLPSKSIRIQSAHHLHSHHLLPKWLWQPPDCLTLPPIVYTAATVIPLEYKSHVSLHISHWYPPLSEQKPLQNRIQNPQGGVPSPALVPGLLSDLISYHWRSFSIEQFHEHTKHTPATGPLHMIQLQQEHSDSDSHTAHSLTSHVCLLTCHLLGQAFSDHNNSTSSYSLSPWNACFIDLHCICHQPGIILNLLSVSFTRMHAPWT